MNTLKVDKGKTKFIAHRGLSGLETENTAAAFVAAGNRSYFGIETDVHKTADGKFIIIHDDNTSRVSGQSYTVEESKLSLLRGLKLYDKIDGKIRGDLVLQTPEEYFSICKKYDKTAVFELKNELEKDDILSLIKLIKNIGMLEKTIFISFSLKNLINLKSVLPNQSAQYLVSSINNLNELIATLKKYSLDIDAKHTSLSHDIISKLHRENIKVNAWTVDDSKIAKRLIDAEIDYITTNILEGV